MQVLTTTKKFIQKNLQFESLCTPTQICGKINKKLISFFLNNSVCLNIFSSVSKQSISEKPWEFNPEIEKKKSLCLANKILKKYDAAPAMGVINVMNSPKPTPYINIYWISHNISGISQILHVFWSVNSL